MAIKYERVTFLDGDKSRTVVLRITGGESARFLRGTEVQMDGEEVSRRTFANRVRIIDKACVTKRVPLQMNTKYATLERI